jgi:hypothetical protein
MKTNMDLENVITLLKGQKSVSLKEMMEKVGVERGGFLSWRRSSNKGRRDELAKKLIDAYPQHFEEIEDKPNPAERDVRDKYTEFLEKEIERLRFENDRLLRMVEQKLSDKTA